jgi:hypothetical protein
MSPTRSQPLPPETLRPRVEEVVRRHWLQPQPAGTFEPRPSERVAEVARAALDTLLTRPFRVGPLPPPAIYDQLLDRIRRFVRRGKPIKTLVGFGPLKNQNAVTYNRADWAEFFALCHLIAWHNKVCRVYPPGLHLQIIFDNETLSLANYTDRRMMKAYMASVADLIEALGFSAVLARPRAQSSLLWPLRFGPYQLFRFTLWQIAEWRIRRWERDPANQEHLQQMIGAARRNLTFPPELPPDERERQIVISSHRFRVCWEALNLGSRIIYDPSRILALYLDGSQHHLHQVVLHLTSLDKGQVTQPWQGEGVLLDNGHQKLEPFVLTAGRRPRYCVRHVEVLELVPCPGFDRIAVVWPNSPEAPARVDTIAETPA